MIRKANTQDEQVIYELLCELEETKFPRDTFRDIYLHDLNDSNHICYVYEEKNQVLGMIHMRNEMQWHHMQLVCEILELVVFPHTRSKGVGKQLIDQAIQTAKDLNCDTIELTTNKRRTRAHHFYEMNDFIQSHYKYTKKL